MRIAATSLALGALCTSLTPAFADDKDSPPRRIVTVGFGAGMNTNQPGNPANHHVIPDTVRINVGDVVNFAVAGFHIVRVYGNGVKLSDVKGGDPRRMRARCRRTSTTRCMRGSRYGRAAIRISSTITTDAHVDRHLARARGAG